MKLNIIEMTFGNGVTTSFEIIPSADLFCVLFIVVLSDVLATK